MDGGLPGFSAERRGACFKVQPVDAKRPMGQQGGGKSRRDYPCLPLEVV